MHTIKQPVEGYQISFWFSFKLLVVRQVKKQHNQKNEPPFCLQLDFFEDRNVPNKTFVKPTLSRQFYIHKFEGLMYPGLVTDMVIGRRHTVGLISWGKPHVDVGGVSTIF